MKDGLSKKDSVHNNRTGIEFFTEVEPDHKNRCREATQKIIECIGSCGGPESLEGAIDRVTAYIESLRKENRLLKNQIKE